MLPPLRARAASRLLPPCPSSSLLALRLGSAVPTVRCLASADGMPAAEAQEGGGDGWERRASTLLLGPCYARLEDKQSRRTHASLTARELRSEQRTHAAPIPARQEERREGCDFESADG